jgi:hypothetical protein
LIIYTDINGGAIYDTIVAMSIDEAIKALANEKNGSKAKGYQVKQVKEALLKLKQMNKETKCYPLFCGYIEYGPAEGLTSHLYLPLPWE